MSADKLVDENINGQMSPRLKMWSPAVVSSTSSLGLSSAHVSRTLSSLKDQGLIDSDNVHVHLCERDALVELCSFDPVYLDDQRRGLLYVLAFGFQADSVRRPSR